MTPKQTPIPRQARSRETLERILCAAEALLAERLFEQWTMADVAQEAGVAVGTIYTRFKSKEDLLPVLFTRHDSAIGARVAKLFERIAAGNSLSARIEIVVAFAVDYHVQHRGLLRALTMFVRAHPDSVPAETWKTREGQYRLVAEALVGEGEELPRARKVDETMFCLAVVNSVCREQVLFGEVTPLRGRRPSNAALKKRLVKLVLRDLTVPEPLPRNLQ